jgi:hypothetical protein
MRHLFVAMLLAAAAPSALANVPAVAASATAQPHVAVAEGDFAKQRARIETDLADGKTYAEISQADRARVRESLARISAQLNGVASVDELSEPARVAVFNDQEIINTVLTQAAADSRLLCERVQKLGTHRRTTQCETVAERRRRSQQDRHNLQQLQSRTPSLEGN